MMKDKTALLIAGLVVIGMAFALTIYLVMSKTTMESSTAQLVGGFQALAGIIVGYYWGSSSGSAAKSEALNEVKKP